MEILVQLALNGIIAGGIYALIALGFNLVYGTTKFFNLAHGAIAAVGGYSVFFFSRQLGLDFYLSVVLGVLVAGFAGWLLNALIFSVLRKRKASNTVLLVASLGALTVVQALIAITFSSQFQTLTTNFAETRTFNIFGGIITENQIVILALVALVTIGLSILIKFTTFGRMISAICDDEEAATIIGIPTERVIGWVFAIGSAIAGLGGIMVGLETGIEPTMGMSLLLKGVIATIIGGIGSVFGGVLGGFLLGLVENFGIWKISAEWKDAIAFAILILFLLFRPSGILNSKFKR